MIQGDITDERLEEIKIEHYNRKMAGTFDKQNSQKQSSAKNTDGNTAQKRYSQNNNQNNQNIQNNP